MFDSFCDTHCPWQRAAATRTPTGRLRQLLRRGTDLSLRGILANVADEHVNRPPKAPPVRHPAKPSPSECPPCPTPVSPDPLESARGCSVPKSGKPVEDIYRGIAADQVRTRGLPVGIEQVAA